MQYKDMQIQHGGVRSGHTYGHLTIHYTHIWLYLMQYKDMQSQHGISDHDSIPNAVRWDVW